SLSPIADLTKSMGINERFLPNRSYSEMISQLLMKSWAGSISSKALMMQNYI
ncbi:MAG: hypothetical protein IPO37_03815, partial [Saprospiraceae bacterium]|nr:hypothetical protein [Saprospiraceae bacterium]